MARPAYTASSRAVFYPNPNRAQKIHVLRHPTQPDASYSMMPVLQDSQLFDQNAAAKGKLQLQQALGGPAQPWTVKSPTSTQRTRSCVNIPSKEYVFGRGIGKLRKSKRGRLPSSDYLHSQRQVNLQIRQSEATVSSVSRKKSNRRLRKVAGGMVKISDSRPNSSNQYSGSVHRQAGKADAAAGASNSEYGHSLQVQSLRQMVELPDVNVPTQPHQTLDSISTFQLGGQQPSQNAVDHRRPAHVDALQLEALRTRGITYGAPTVDHSPTLAPALGQLKQSRSQRQRDARAIQNPQHTGKSQT